MYCLDALGPGHSSAVWPWLYGVVLALTVLSTVWQLGAGITATPAGVFARRQSFRQSGRLEWAEIHHFALDGYRRGIGAWTVDGRWVGLMKYGSFGGTAAEMLQRLERYRWEQQQALGLVP